MDVDTIQTILDPEYSARARAETLAYDEALGETVRALRTKAGLRQKDIPGLSTRQVGRIERGEVHPRLYSFRALATAHDLPISEYLEALARKARAG